MKNCSAALKIYEQLNNEEGTADALYGLGLALQGLRKFDDALNSFNRALEIWKRTKNYEAIVYISLDIGNTHLMKEEIDKAVPSFKVALEVAQKLKDDGSMADALSAIGEAYELSEEFGKSADSFLAATERYLKAGMDDLAEEYVYRVENLIPDLTDVTAERIKKKMEEMRSRIPKKQS